MISLSYSRISLADIAQKLQLDSPEDAEFIVAKVGWIRNRLIWGVASLSVAESRVGGDWPRGMGRAVHSLFRSCQKECRYEKCKEDRRTGWDKGYQKMGFLVTFPPYGAHRPSGMASLRPVSTMRRAMSSPRR
jgi:hypothetical protein